MDTTTLPPPAFSPFTPVDGFDTDVVVVGLGPAGATAALALATYGVRVHAVTMFPWVANSPRAHITNQRAVEVLRDLGHRGRGRKYATPWDQMGDTLFTTSLAGEEIVRLQTWGTGDRPLGRLPAGQPLHDAGHPAAADGAAADQERRRARARSSASTPSTSTTSRTPTA